jgi:phosphoribosylformylglycinamidine synthase
MLCVCTPERVDDVLAVCARWEVGGTVIGEVTDGSRLRVLSGDEVVGDLPVEALVDDCPLYDLAPEPPSAPIYPAPPRMLRSEEPAEVLLELLRSPNVASRRPVFEQYDHLVGSRTVRRPEQADAAVLRLPLDGADAPDAPVPALAVSIDGNGRRVACDPYVGAMEAVLECAANLACVGAEPLGLTNCLNFGNPEKPHIAWQLTEAVRGLGDGCRALGVPVVGGNVSLYNEGGEGPIYPTPVVGMVGELPDARRAGRTGFARPGDAIALVGAFAPDLHASELAKLGGAELPSSLPEIDLDAVRAAIATVRDAVREGALSSAHDVAEGGLGVALAECCLAGGVGATVRLEAPGKPLALLFGEGPGGFVVSGPRDAVAALGTVIGEVGGDELRIEAGGSAIAHPLTALAAAHGALAALLA